MLISQMIPVGERMYQVIDKTGFVTHRTQDEIDALCVAQKSSAEMVIGYRNKMEGYGRRRKPVTISAVIYDEGRVVQWAREKLMG